MTPLMRQYFATKAEYPGIILFFQVGDFFELFFEDAEHVAPLLGFALTSRGTHEGKPIPLCGVPVHAADNYIAQLVKRGFRVALCRQISEARPGVVVDRAVTDVITPGTVTSAHALDIKKTPYCAALKSAQGTWGLVILDVLGAACYATTGKIDDRVSLFSEIDRFKPAEIIIDKSISKDIATALTKYGIAVLCSDDVVPEICYDTALQEVLVHRLLPGFSILQALLATVIGYCRRQQISLSLDALRLEVYQADDFLVMDAGTRSSLDIVVNAHTGTRQGTLWELCDTAQTPMGSRLIGAWLARPLCNKVTIDERLDVVEFLCGNYSLREQLQHQAAALGDIERIIGRIALAKARPDDYKRLHKSLFPLHAIFSLCATVSQQLPSLLKRVIEDYTNVMPLAEYLQQRLDHEHDEYVIKSGFNYELDSLRSLRKNHHAALLEMESAEQERTGISSLKIREYKEGQFAIEVTKLHTHKIPDDYVRLQTLTQKERYISPALQQLEQDIAHAHEKAIALEAVLFQELCSEVADWVKPIRAAAKAVAIIDALVAFAHNAVTRRYTRPIITTDRIFEIQEGKHPVLAVSVKEYVPTSFYSDTESYVQIITGPNMGGKSTHMRQIALNTVLAHVGSYIPAAHARIPVVDKIFTRIGASDNALLGKSTFWVEVEETAHICRTATSNSLVIIDELGRGTSTADGQSLAASVIEYLHTTVGSWSICATHYHEIVHVLAQLPGVRVAYCQSAVQDGDIVFFYTLKEGIADSSFGIHVAMKAGMPPAIIIRAQEHLQVYATKEASSVVSLQQYAPILEEKRPSEPSMLEQVLSGINPDDLTPRQALEKLFEMKRLLQE